MIFALLFILITGICCQNAFAQELLSNQNASWTTVLPGSVITEPALLDYGFCLETDAKNLLAISYSGKTLWEKNFSKSKNIKISALPHGFLLFFDNDKNLLKLINPSGSLVWEKKLKIKTNNLSNTFLAGRDGRFFINDNKELYCYGMNGICRWSLSSLNLKDLPAQELPDGSLIYFTAEKNGQTCGIRISPFGQLLEEITFSGKIKDACWCEEGILLSFEDGTAGLFSLEDGFAKNKWVFGEKKPGISFCVSDDKKDLAVLIPSDKKLLVYFINPSNGKVLQSFITEINAFELKKTYLSKSGLFLADGKNACFYKKDGGLINKSLFENQNLKSAWSYLSFTNENYLIMCRKNWTLDAFHFAQASGPLKKNEKNAYNPYPSYILINKEQFYYSSGSFDNSMTDKSLLDLLKRGNYGQKEEELLSNVLSTGYAYNDSLNKSDFGIRIENSIFDSDTSGLEAILTLLPYFSCSSCTECAALIIRSADNYSILNAILTGLAENGYDPEGKILAALEARALSINPKNVTTINKLCDAVLSICHYMGSPAYFSKGRSILRNFMSPQYDAKCRQHVREVLKELVEFQ